MGYQSPIDKIANDYPDSVVQDIAMSIFTLTGKPDINEDTESYSGSFTTRPLKLGGSMTLKSLRAVKHLFDSDEGTIGLSARTYEESGSGQDRTGFDEGTAGGSLDSLEYSYHYIRTYDLQCKESEM